MAGFALKGHALGVPLPAGKFTDPKNSLKKQWEQYIKAECGENDLINLHLQVSVEDSALAVYASACPRLNVFRLKPVIERIKAVDEKVAWFVYDAVRKASSHNYPVYQLSDFADFAQMVWHRESVTDEEMAEQLRQEEDTPDATIEDLRKTYSFPWPSALAVAVDGHEWMLNRQHYSYGRHVPASKPPAIATLKKAKEFAESGAPAQLRRVVAAAIALVTEVARKSSTMRTIARPGREDDEDEDYHEHVNSCGASCGVVWDDPEVFLEALYHWETSEMESGETTEVHLVLTADLGCEEQYEKVVQQLKDLIRHHVCVSRLLQQFPRLNDD